MSDRPLPEASAEELSRVAARLSEAPSLSLPAGSTISGVIEISPELAGSTSAADVVYVIARDPESQGPPLAVERLTGNGYPMRFVLDVTPAMLPGAAQRRPLQLIVKVDRDGDVETSSPEDLLGFTPPAVLAGESGVRVTVEESLAELAALVGPDASGARISGTISLPPALGERTSASDVVFVVARRPGAQGPPVAVARLEGNRYPMAFTLDDRSLMLGGIWPEAVEIEARVDGDGDPLTRAPRDLAGRAPGPARPGDLDVRIELGG